MSELSTTEIKSRLSSYFEQFNDLLESFSYLKSRCMEQPVIESLSKAEKSIQDALKEMDYLLESL